MHVRVLGPVEVEVAGERRVPEVARVRALLGALALRVGRTVSTDELIDALWGDDPPRSAAKTLQGHVSALRRVLGPDAIVTGPGGYALQIDPDDVDVASFERLVGTAREVAGPEPRRARDLYGDALALWRGQPLVDLADGPMRQGQLVRLEELRCAAIEGRIDAELRLGRHVEVLPELRRLVEEMPLREHLWEDLMIALYRDERQAEALDAYQELRRVLGDQLGIEPSTTLQELETAILLHDPALDETPQPPRHNIPSPLSSFVGRVQEIGQVEKCLNEHRLVTLLGPGGVGKSRLAIEAARRLLPNTTDGVWWVDLTGVSGPDVVLSHLASTLEVAPAPGVSLDAALEAHVRARSLLIVFDNCEHVHSSAAGLIKRVLEAGASVRVLATSRVPLGLPGEFQHRVEPMAVAGLDDDPLAADAVRLFIERAADRRVHIDDESELQAVAEICRALDGLPLAIELVAARSRVLTPIELRAQVDQPGRLLALEGADFDQRHRSLEVTFDASYDLLDSSAQRLFERLAVFAGDFDLAAVIAVGVFEPVTAEPAEVVGSLVDASLLECADLGEGRRFRLLELVKSYAGRRLDERGEREIVERRHAHHYRDLAVAAGEEVEGANASAWFDVLRREDHNVRQAMCWLLEHGESTDALAFAGAVGRAWYVRGDLAGCRRLLTELLDRSPEAPSRLRAMAHLRLGWPVFLGGDIEGGMAAVEAARTCSEEAGDSVGEARAVRDLAHMILLGTGDVERAMPLYRRAIALLGEAGERHQRAWAQIEMAQAVLLADRDEPGVAESLDDAEAVLVAVQDHTALAHLAMDRVFLAYRCGDLDGAESAATVQVGESRAVGDLVYEQIALIALGVVAAERGNGARSRPLLLRAVELAWETGNQLQLGIALQGVAAVTVNDDAARSAELWGAALALSPPYPLFLRRYGAMLAPGRAALGSRFDELVEEGRRLPAAAIVEVARTALGATPP